MTRLKNSHGLDDDWALAGLAPEAAGEACEVAYLRDVLLWGSDDPLFPATMIALGPTRQFQATGLERKHWSNAEPIRTIFREAFSSAGLPYFNPHSFRDMLVRHAMQLNLTVMQLKAWSQNLGHSDLLTTFTSYGAVPVHKQGELIRELGKSAAQIDPAMVAQVVAAMQQLAGDGTG